VATPIANMEEALPLDSGSAPTLAPTALPEVQVHIDIVGGELRSASGPLESISALSAFTMLESMSLTEDANGFFYDRKHIRYKRTGEEGQYIFEPITSILEGNVLSPAISEGMSTPIGNTNLQKVVESSSPPSRSSVTDPSVVEDTDAVAEKETKEQTQSPVRVVETQEDEMS